MKHQLGGSHHPMDVTQKSSTLLYPRLGERRESVTVLSTRPSECERWRQNMIFVGTVVRRTDIYRWHSTATPPNCPDADTDLHEMVKVVRMVRGREISNTWFLQTHKRTRLCQSQTNKARKMSNTYCELRMRKHTRRARSASDQPSVPKQSLRNASRKKSHKKGRHRTDPFKIFLWNTLREVLFHLRDFLDVCNRNTKVAYPAAIWISILSQLIQHSFLVLTLSVIILIFTALPVLTPVQLQEEGGTAGSGGETGDNMGNNGKRRTMTLFPSVVSIPVPRIHPGCLQLHQSRRFSLHAHFPNTPFHHHLSTPPWKSTIAACGDSRTPINGSLALTPSQLTPNTLALIVLCADRGGLKLRSRFNTQMMPLPVPIFRHEDRLPVGDDDAASKRRARNDMPVWASLASLRTETWPNAGTGGRSVVVGRRIPWIVHSSLPLLLLLSFRRP